MCVASAVLDQYRPYVPNRSWPICPQPRPAPYWSPEQLRQLLDSLRQAYEAAATFDRLTGQPDCEDPEKAKLLERVAELERRLDSLGV